jgi:hypothetical protein
MSNLKGLFYTILPTAVFSFFAYLTATGQLDDPSQSNTRRGRGLNELLWWLSDTLGALPAGAAILAVGLVLSFFAYRKYLAA